MFKAFKRILTAALVVLATSSPAVAYARIDLNPPRRSVTSGQVQGPVIPSVQPKTTSSPQSFRWDDAGIGAACMLVLLSVGSGVLVMRRRAHRPLTS